MASDRTRFGLALAAFAIVLTSPAAAKKPKPAQTDNWGEAVRQTMSAQIIDPNPQYDSAVPVSNGERVSAATDRYRAGRVKQPDNVSASRVGRQAAAASN